MTLSRRHRAPVGLARFTAGASETLPQYRFPIFMMDFVVPGPVAMLPVAGLHIARRDAAVKSRLAICGLARPVVSAQE